MYKIPRGGWAAPLLVVVLAACAQSPAQPSATAPSGAAIGSLEVLLTKSPTCACCEGHEAYLEQMGFRVQVTVTQDISAVKAVYGIPSEMWSCHTSTVGRYFVEGHVPYAAIQKLLAERPEIDGISLPGMPAGSPGHDGVLAGPLVVYAIADGEVVGEFGSY